MYGSTEPVAAQTPRSTECETNNNNNNPVHQMGRFQRMVHAAWIVHVLAGLLIIYSGVLVNNDSKKYIPIKPSKVGTTCRKAFVNVFAESSMDRDAIICCEGTEGGTLFAAGLCESSKLPFARHLARFPQAWLLPLFPLIVRFLYSCHRNTYATIRRGVRIESYIPAFRRFMLYLVLMNFRGLILYLALNLVEDQIVEPNPAGCWYRDLLYDYQPDCYGRQFDFSDHVVLFFAQILPIALVEFLHSIQVIYWKDRHYNLKESFCHALPITLLAGMIYLYYIIFYASYKTAAFFHTGSEVYAGYLISILALAPLYCLQCTAGSKLGKFFFPTQP